MSFTHRPAMIAWLLFLYLRPACSVSKSDDSLVSHQILSNGEFHRVSLMRREAPREDLLREFENRDSDQDHSAESGLMPRFVNGLMNGASLEQNKAALDRTLLRKPTQATTVVTTTSTTTTTRAPSTTVRSTTTAQSTQQPTTTTTTVTTATGESQIFKKVIARIDFRRTFRTRPINWFVADDFDAAQNRWPNRGNGSSIINVTRTGSVNKTSSAGWGASQEIVFLQGDVNTSLHFGNIVETPNFTICSLTRYSGDKKGRILNGGGNWFFGHSQGTAGVAFMQRWVTGTTDLRNSNWVALCARTGNSTRDVALGGIPIGSGNQTEMPMNGEITVNSNGQFGCCTENEKERSDFAIAEIIVWQGDALREGMRYLQRVLREGRDRRGGRELRGFPTQSSTFEARIASMATDRNLGSIAETTTEDNPWWQVDLGSTQLVGQIRILNRAGACASRLFSSNGACIFERSAANFTADNEGAVVGVADEGCGGGQCFGHICGRLTKPSNMTHWYSVECRSTAGRFVYIRLPGKARALNFNEIQILRPRKVRASRIDLSNLETRDFRLTATIVTNSSSATIAGKTFKKGLWRPGTLMRLGFSVGQPKLLYLRNGRVAFDAGLIGTVVGSTPVNDGRRHEVGVHWDSNTKNFSILVDGEEDNITSNTLNSSLIIDDPEARFVVGISVGSQVDEVANGDVAKTMLGLISKIQYNGVRVAVPTYMKVPKRDVQLASSRDESFNLSALLRTRAQNATIVGKTFKGGLWRRNDTNSSEGQSKLLYLQRGRLCFRIGNVGSIEGSTPVNDGKMHEVAIRWNRREGTFSLVVDGQVDVVSKDDLRSKFIPDDSLTRLLVGRAVGTRFRRGGNVSSDITEAMDGWVGRIRYNGADVNVRPFRRVGPSSIALRNAWPRNFTLTAKMQTRSENGTIMGQVFNNGLWRNGSTGHAKLLYLSDGRLIYRVGYAGLLRGRSLVNDGQEHEVGISWDSGTKALSVVVDGKVDATTSGNNSLGSQVYEDDVEASFVLGTAVGEHIVNGRASGDVAPQFNGRISDLRYRGRLVDIRPYWQVSAAAVDMSNSVSRDFSLWARIGTTAENATIFAKTLANGLWRPGNSSEQPKILFLRRGRVCYQVGAAGVIEGNTTVNDGHPHWVGVTWNASLKNYTIMVDGQTDAIATNTLQSQVVGDGNTITLQLGVAVGSNISDDATKSDVAPMMVGRISRLRYNGARVLIPPFGEVPPASIDLGLTDSDFNLSAVISTIVENATIAGKVYLDGLWRQGPNGTAPKLLALRRGRLAFDVGNISLEGRRRLDDGVPHEVSVAWNVQLRTVSLFADGMVDATSPTVAQLVADDDATSFVLGLAVGSHVANNVANSDKSPAMVGIISDVKYNGVPVSVARYIKAAIDSLPSSTSRPVPSSTTSSSVSTSTTSTLTTSTSTTTAETAATTTSAETTARKLFAKPPSPNFTSSEARKLEVAKDVVPTASPSSSTEAAAQSKKSAAIGVSTTLVILLVLSSIGAFAWYRHRRSQQATEETPLAQEQVVEVEESREQVLEVEHEDAGIDC